MPISVKCSSCGQRLKAKDTLAGRTVPCPKCGEKLLIPQVEEESATYLLETETPPEPPKLPDAVEPEPDDTVQDAPPPPVKRPPKPAAALPPLSVKEPPLWLRHLHWLLVLALVPLAWSLLQPESDRDDFEKRLYKTLQNATPEQRDRILHVLENLDEGKGTLEKLFAAFPEQKLVGAFLPRQTWIHWIFAACTAVMFMAFFWLLATHQTAHPMHLLVIGFFTATIGIVVLLIFQSLAHWSQGVWLHGRSIVVILFYIVKLIGFSYQAALDPENGFFLSFLGYTLGVGFCEEVIKALPLLWLYRRSTDQTWRGAFLWGLASGAGFGIAEGIMYASNYYNGVSGPDIYVVRFISCVALHALWTGSVGITLNQNQEMIQQEMAWYEFILPLFVIVGVPMVLHGLYDTLLKKEMNGWALVVALLSFGFLAFQISRLHGEDDEEAKESMLREYQRRKSMA